MIPTGEFEGYAIVFASRRNHCQARLLAHLHAHPRPRSINSNRYFLGAGTPDPFQRLRASTGPGTPRLPLVATLLATAAVCSVSVLSTVGLDRAPSLRVVSPRRRPSDGRKSTIRARGPASPACDELSGKEASWPVRPDIWGWGVTRIRVQATLRPSLPIPRGAAARQRTYPPGHFRPPVHATTANDAAPRN
jgi:hypothetical protein